MKKGQIQNMETIGIIIIVIILLIIGIVFWSNVTKSDIDNSKEEFGELQILDIAKSLNELPEFNCYVLGNEFVECVDLYKVLAFNKTMNSGSEESKRKMNRLYSEYFKISKITLEQIYPEPFVIEFYNNNISNASKISKIYLPTQIKDNINNTNNFGLIVVEGYIR